MDKLPVLFLCICSHAKEPVSSVFEYTTHNSIINEIDTDYYNELMARRSTNLGLVLEDELYRDGRKIRYLESNKSLLESRDLHIDGPFSGNYLPAFDRYKGRFYQQLGNNRSGVIVNKLNSHLLIISTLYGILMPLELIQYYSVSLKDSTMIAQNWQEDDFLTQSLINYINLHKIHKVIDLMGDDDYKRLINWADLRALLGKNVIHTHSYEYMSPDILMPLGDLLNSYLNDSNQECFLNNFSEGKSIDTKFEKVYFSSTKYPSNTQLDNNNKNVFREDQKAKDNIRRMKSNVNHVILDLCKTHHIQTNERIGIGLIIKDLNRNHIITKQIHDKLRQFCGVRNNLDYDYIKVNHSVYDELYKNYMDILEYFLKRQQITPLKLEYIDPPVGSV